MRVGFTSRAQHHLRAAKDWWRKNRDKAPNALDEEVERAIEILGANPLAGKPVRDAVGVRKLTIPRIHYDLYYRIADDLVEVLALWHVRRGAPPKL